MGSYSRIFSCQEGGAVRSVSLPAEGAEVIVLVICGKSVACITGQTVSVGFMAAIVGPMALATAVGG